jgi:hypothetical protein
MTTSDITGMHSGGPHINFETGRSVTQSGGRVTFEVSDNMHIFLTDF